MTDPAKQFEQERNKAVRVEAELFARDNLQACCAEVLEWQGTGILTQGKVRALAAIYQGSVQVSDGDELRVAEATIHREAMRFTSRATSVSPAQPSELSKQLREWGTTRAMAAHYADLMTRAADEIDRLAAPTKEQSDLHSSIAGRVVSVDVSTGDDDAGHRIFAELTGEVGSDGATLIATVPSDTYGLCMMVAEAAHRAATGGKSMPSDRVREIVEEVIGTVAVAPVAGEGREIGEIVAYALTAYKKSMPVEKIFTVTPTDANGYAAAYVTKALAHFATQAERQPQQRERSEGTPAAQAAPTVFYAEQSALDSGQVDMIVTREANKTFTVPLTTATPASPAPEAAAPNALRDAAIKWAQVHYRNVDEFTESDLQIVIDTWKEAHRAGDRHMRDRVTAALGLDAGVPFAWSYLLGLIDRAVQTCGKREDAALAKPQPDLHSAARDLLDCVNSLPIDTDEATTAALTAFDRTRSRLQKALAAEELVAAAQPESIDTPAFRNLVDAHVAHALNGGMHIDKPKVWNDLVAHINNWRRASIGQVMGTIVHQALIHAAGNGKGAQWEDVQESELPNWTGIGVTTRTLCAAPTEDRVSKTAAAPHMGGAR